MPSKYKYLTFLSMLYMTIKLVTVVLIYKIISIGPISATAATLIIPAWFFLGDIITEAYGYDISRHVIWTAVACQFIFACICACLIQFPSPPFWIYQSAYDQVLGKLPRVVTASFLAITLGAFLNAYVLMKWKILFHGKKFWLRSLGATAVGELCFTVIALGTEYCGIMPLAIIAQLIAVSYAIKLLMSPILVFPASLIANWIKKSEGIDIYDHDTNFNPFYFKIEQNKLAPIDPSSQNIN